MRNKGAFIVLLVYGFVLFLVSFLKDLMEYLTSPVLIMLKDDKSIETVSVLLEYFIYFLVYFGFGGTLMIVIFSNVQTYKSIILYTILIILATISLSMMFRSFVGAVYYIKYVFKVVFCIVGSAISFLILERNVRKKQK